MADVVSESLRPRRHWASWALGASRDEAGQLARNRHVSARNPRVGGSGPGDLRLMVGTTDGGRVLTLVIERTVEPTTWLIVTGWSSTDAERTLLDSWR